MSYMSIATCVADNAFGQRITACWAQEGGNPYQMPNDLIWDVATRSDIEQSYEYALDAGTPNPGADDTVITDGMILAAVQDIKNGPPPVVNPS